MKSRPFVEETLAARWRRRALTVPGVALLTCLYLALFPLIVVGAALRDLRFGRRLPTLRLALFGAVYLACETLGLLASGALWVACGGGRAASRQRWERWNFSLQRVWAGALFAAVRRIFSLTLEIEGDAEVGDGPLLVFVRHASLADTLLPSNLLSIRHGLRLRYVLKRELLFDPCLDVVGQRLPNVFVQRGSGDGKREIDSIRRLAADLGDDEGLLIYPEGTRFSPARQARALERIAASGDIERLERARSLSRVLPPRTGGPQALLETRPDADVLIVGHVGLDGLTKLRDFVDGSLVGRHLHIRFHRVPAAAIPRERPGRIEWLDAEWARLDAWIQTTLAADARRREG